MLTADPHCHTTASDGEVTPQQLVEAAVRAHLDLIAVTDHDTMDAVSETQKRGEAVGLTVVPGQEVTTKPPAQTHILGWFLDKPIKRGMSLADTVDAIHDQGGLAIVPHPFMPIYFGSIQPGMLRRLLEKRRVDGIEIMFTVPIGPWRRKQLDEFFARNRERLGAALGGSDCHFGSGDISRVVTDYEGDFKTAVQLRTTVPRLARKRRSVSFGSAVRHEWNSLVNLPLKRLRGQL